MSLLDQLAKQSAQRRVGVADVAAQQADREANYKLLEATQVQFKEYLEQLCKLLAEHPEKIQQRYEIPGYGTITASIAHDYSVRLNNLTKGSVEVTVSFNANVQSELCPSVEVQGVSRIQTIKALFDKQRIPALLDAKKDASGAINQATFRARGKIPLSISALAELSTGQVKLTLVNFEDLGQSIKHYSAEAFNEQLFDQIGYYLARKDNELTKEKLPDGVLKKLRHTAQQNEMRRKWEEKLAAQAAAEEQRQRFEQDQQKLSNRVLAQSKEFGKSLMGKLSGLIKKKD
jgi:plasmid stabilization system protein ParE